MDRSRQLIATAAIVVAATGVITSLAKGKGMPGTRWLIAFGAAFFITSLFADLGAPRFAAALALIIMVGTILENAPAVIDFANKRGGK